MFLRSCSSSTRSWRGGLMSCGMDFLGPAHRCRAGSRVHRDTATIIRCFRNEPGQTRLSINYLNHQHHQGFHLLRSRRGSPSYEFKHYTEVLGLPTPCARTTWRTSEAETIHPRGHASYSAWFHSTAATLTLCRTLRSSRFNDDTSSVRDDYTVWMTADPTTVRARHMTNP